MCLPMLAALTGAGFLIRHPTRRTYRRGGRDRTPAAIATITTNVIT